MPSSSPATTLNESLPGAVGDADLEKADAAESPSPAATLNEPVAEEKDLEKAEVSVSPAEDPFLVKWDANDPANPLNWPSGRRWRLTMATGSMNLVSAFISANPSGIAQDQMEYFGFGEEVAALLIGIFVAGYIVGPICWGPLSERRGRKFVFIVSYVPFLFWQIGCALSRTTTQILIFRFLSGVFGAAPQSVAAAVVGDIHPASTRGLGMAVFAAAPFSGPALGPIVSGFIHDGGVSWRWVYWIGACLSGLCVLWIVFILPETYAPVLLTRKAQRIRQETGDDRFQSPMERNRKPASPARLAYDLLASPFIMLVQEPMLLATSIYCSYVFGNLYLCLAAMPLIFVGNHGWNLGEEGLAFLGIPFGAVLGCILTLLVFNPRYARRLKAALPARVQPELRLEMVLVAGPIYGLAFFIIGWTSYPRLTPVGPIVGLTLIGFCCINLFLGLINYTVDVYLAKAATAMSANAILRSIFGASFPLFANIMFRKLGIPYASTLLGCIAFALVPVPVLFWFYGPKLRAMSKSKIDYSAY